jgi:2-hydroxy-6-oxonona-2,4-dienedioate hydrolase
MGRVIFNQSLVTPDAIEEEFRVNNSPGAKESLAVLGDYIAADLDRDVVGAKLSFAHVPILLIWGDQDKTVPLALAEQARELLPHSRLALLADAAHTAYFERPDDFNAILIDFLHGKMESYHAQGVTWK